MPFELVGVVGANGSQQRYRAVEVAALEAFEVGEVVSNAGPSARERRRGGEGRR